MDISPSVYEHAASFIGETPWKTSRDPRLFLRAHREAFLMYRHSPVLVGIDIYNLEAEAYGALVEEPTGCGVPAVTKHPCSTIDELADLPPFDPAAAGRIPMVAGVGVDLAESLPGTDVRIPVSGPFSIASSLMGFENLLCEATLRPDRTRSALIRLAEAQVAFCEYIHRRRLGVSLFESAAAPPLLSPELFRTVELPALKVLVERVSSSLGRSIPCILGGDTTPVLDCILQTGARYVICPSETDQKAFMEKMRARPDVAVRINMRPDIIAGGTWDEIRREAERALELARDRENVCLGTGALPYETPPENVVRLMEYVKSR